MDEKGEVTRGDPSFHGPVTLRGAPGSVVGAGGLGWWPVTANRDEAEESEESEESRARN